MDNLPTIYTIGYSPHDADTFIDILIAYGINVVADVRSSPFSTHKTEFNQNTLKSLLLINNIKYVFLGDLVGARFKDPSVYINGIADYEKIAKHPVFQEGLTRIKTGMRNYSIVLMCAEKDPITCHRTILISRHLSPYARIFHILEDGTLESHSQAEIRLIKLLKLDQLSLPGFANQQIAVEAYRRQGREIAYRAKQGEKVEQRESLYVQF